MTDATFTVSLGDLDEDARLRGGVYVDRADTLRGAWLAGLGFDRAALTQADLSAVVVRMELDRQRDVAPGDTLAMTQEQVGLSPDGARWVLRTTFTRADGLSAALVTTTGGWLDARRSKVARPPAGLAQAMAALPKAADWAPLPGAGR